MSVKNIFEIIFHRDEKIFSVQVFFSCLDYTSRLPKTCSEHSGKLKHASARDSVSRLSIKMMGNRHILVENHALSPTQMKDFREKHKLRSHFLAKVASWKKLQLFSQIFNWPLVFFIAKVYTRSLAENYLEPIKPTEAPVRDRVKKTSSFP